MKLAKFISQLILIMIASCQVHAQHNSKYKCWVYSSNNDIEPALKYNGTILSVSDTGIVLLPVMSHNMLTADIGQTVIPVTEISEIRIRKKNSILKGTLIGAGAGILAGAGIGYATGNRDQVNFFDGNTWGNAPEIRAFFGGVLGGIAGTLIGIIIGSEKISFQIDKKPNRFKRQKADIEAYSLKQ